MCHCVHQDSTEFSNVFTKGVQNLGFVIFSLYSVISNTSEVSADVPDGSVSFPISLCLDKRLSSYVLAS